MMLVDSKTAVITGAASGIGRETAQMYAANGANVVVADLDEDGGHQTVENIRSEGGEATFVHTDVSKASDVREMIEVAVAEYGGLDVLFNNAGIEGPLSLMGEYDEDDFDTVVSINLRGVFLGIKYGIQAMLEDGGGSIVNTSSVAGSSGVPGRGGYSATKAGVMGMTRTAAVEYAEDNIRINSVLPGIIDTPMHRRANDQKPDKVEKYATDEPMPGKGSASDIASAALFLGSDHAARITGVSLPVDGGFLVQP